jgi:hypothetical protein
MPVLGTGIHEFASAHSVSTNETRGAKAKPWHDGKRESREALYNARAISTNFSPCQSNRSHMIQPSLAYKGSAVIV